MVGRAGDLSSHQAAPPRDWSYLAQGLAGRALFDHVGLGLGDTNLHFRRLALLSPTQYAGRVTATVDPRRPHVELPARAFRPNLGVPWLS
jgi:hypothetical protein